MGQLKTSEKRESASASVRLPPAICSRAASSKGRAHHDGLHSSRAREWTLSCLLDSKPCGRFDVRELREWIQSRLQRLSQRCAGQEDEQPARLKYAEQVVDIYNAAFQELTRQVAASCTERGQLMADVWTSTNALLGRILMHIKTQTEGFKAMALALNRRDAVVEDACSKLQQLLASKTQEVEDLRKHAQTLEERLEIAESALWARSERQGQKINAS
eukprot:jgi/Ulvmu1/4376/UM002_0101.1